MITICIDPGHGGYDPGAIGPGGAKEKDINLAVGLKLRDLLKLAGFKVIMTRLDDNPKWSPEIDLLTRVKIANETDANYFISLHCNSSNTPEAQGAEIYIYKPGGEAEKLARAIQKQINTITKTRGMKINEFYILKWTNMPAVLLEMGFISNPMEEILLVDAKFQTAIAKAIVNGICQFLGMDFNINWKEKIMEWAQRKDTLDLSPEHKADELAPKWFVIEIARRLKEGI